MRYRWRGNPDDAMATLDVDMPLPRYYSGNYERFPSEHTSYDDREFLHGLVAVPGVAELWVNRYSVTVRKGGMFEWPPLRAEIVRLIEDRYGDAGAPVVAEEYVDD
jgi:hypothetical protein